MEIGNVQCRISCSLHLACSGLKLSMNQLKKLHLLIYSMSYTGSNHFWCITMQIVNDLFILNFYSQKVPNGQINFWPLITLFRTF